MAKLPGSAGEFRCRRIPGNRRMPTGMSAAPTEDMDADRHCQEADGIPDRLCRSIRRHHPPGLSGKGG
jgi:hypothetical protein